MRVRALWRPSVAAAGHYTGTLLAFLATVVAARVLAKDDFGRFALVLAATSFVQVLLDSTVEEAAVKYGFRYAEREDWGRLRRLFAVALRLKLAGGAVAAVVLLALAPLAHLAFAASDLTLPFLVAAAIPLAQAPESLAGAALVLRRRYDIRSVFHGVSLALRFVGIAVGAQFGLVEAIAGIVAAQVVATAAIGLAAKRALGRFPAAAPVPIGEDRGELRRFVGQSAAASTLLAARANIGPALLGAVAVPTQVADFRAAQAPQTGFAAASGPARLFLLTEQTRDFERGDLRRVRAFLRNYMLATAAVMAVIVPPLWIFMEDVVSFLYGGRYETATEPARLILAAAAIQLVWGWSKTFPVSIGRPGLRLVTSGAETAVLVPLLLVLGERSGAEGAAAAVLLAACAFALVWTVLLVRLRGTLAPAAAPAS